MTDTVFACDALGDLYQYNEQLLRANKELLARCDLLGAELATLKNAVMPVVAWWKELKQQPGFCPVPGANFFVLGQHGDKNRVDIKQLETLAALVGEEGCTR